MSEKHSYKEYTHLLFGPYQLPFVKQGIIDNTWDIRDIVKIIPK